MEGWDQVQDRGHLSTHITMVRQRRYLTRHDDAMNIKLAHDSLSDTNGFSLSLSVYQYYPIGRGVAAPTLDPAYNEVIFRRMRLRHDIGRQRHEAKLSRKFGLGSW